MKFKNKESGVIYDTEKNLKIEFDSAITVTMDAPDGLRTVGIYETFSEFCEEWEEYVPKEPLIKDEKIRKAVRAWAEASNIGVVKVAPYAVFDIESSACICFYGRVIKDKDDEKKSYAITELCGEEEEC